MKQSQDGSPLEILVTVDVQITSTRIYEEETPYFRAIMVFSPRDLSSLSYTLDAEILSANDFFRSEKVSDASLEIICHTNLLWRNNPPKYLATQKRIWQRTHCQ